MRYCTSHWQHWGKKKKKKECSNLKRTSNNRVQKATRTASGAEATAYGHGRAAPKVCQVCVIIYKHEAPLTSI
jgi:hypothetical protein